MAWLFVIVGSLLFGAFTYVLWLYGLKRQFVALFKRKRIVECKNHLRLLNLAKIPPKEKVAVYVSDSKISSFEPEIIAEAEKLYFKQKPFDDLVEWLNQREFYFGDILHKKFIFFRVLNNEHEIVKSLLDYKWKPKTIKSALIYIEKELKVKKVQRIPASLPFQNIAPELKPERVKSDIDAPSGAPIHSKALLRDKVPENIQKTQRRFFN